MAYGMDELEPFEGFGFTHILRRFAELRLEGAGEGLMTRVTAVQGDSQNVIRPGSEGTGRLGEPSTTEIFNGGETGGFAKGMRQMEARDIAIYCDLIERKIAVQIAFDDE